MVSQYWFQNESKWFTKRGSKAQQDFDAQVIDKYKTEVDNFFSTFNPNSTKLKAAENILIVDQLSRHVYRKNPAKLDVYTNYAYAYAQQLVLDNVDLDPSIPFWLKLFILLAIRHSNQVEDLRFCENRVRRYKIEDTQDLIRFERFMR